MKLAASCQSGNSNCQAPGTKKALAHTALPLLWGGCRGHAASGRRPAAWRVLGGTGQARAWRQGVWGHVRRQWLVGRQQVGARGDRAAADAWWRRRGQQIWRACVQLGGTSRQSAHSMLVMPQRP